MKNSSRFLTACTSCRRLKRKCDYMKLGHGPCSNCVTRKIAHLCSLDGETSDQKKKSTSSTASSADDNYEHEEESVTTISYSRKRRRIAKTEPSAQTTNSYPDLTPDNPNAIYSKITSKLLSACVVKFFQNAEWSYFLDEDILMNAVIERQTALDRRPIALLYILSACIILRRGVQVSSASGFTGSRKLLTGELFSAHMKSSEAQSRHSIITLQSMILRSHYYLHMEQNEPAWETLYKAISIYNAIAISPRPANNLTIYREGSQQAKYDKTWTALSYLETTLCSLTNRRSTLLLQESSKLPTLFDYDFRLDRRVKTLWYSRETQLIIESTESSQIINDRFLDLESQIVNYIHIINDQEGKLLPFGQIALYGCLIKLCTQNILSLKKEESSTMDYDNSITSAKVNTLRRLLGYSSEFAGCLNALAINCCPPALGSAPFMAMYVFQALTCIWIQAAMEKQTSLANESNSFSLIKMKLLQTLDYVRDDKSICKRTTILFNGLDVLSHLKVDEQDPYDVIIPIQLQSGLSTVSKAWDDERYRAQRQEEAWSNFKPFLDDFKFWSTLTAAAEFDYQMAPFDTSDDWFRLI